ncbi:MAG: transporter [Phycisphaerales bacterium]
MTVGGSSTFTHAQSTPASDDYHLFNPVPDELLRPLSADRPDVTESPYTVDAGRVQIESSIVSFTSDSEGADVDEWVVGSTNLKLGLTSDMDIQFVFDPYINRDEEGAATVDGFGDMQIRLKINLYGNDGGETALAILPFITLPTAADDLGHGHVEGGIAVPWAKELGDGWSLGLMGELDALYRPTDDDYTVEFLHTAALGRELTESLGAYAEYIGVAEFESDSDYRALFGVGLTYAVNRDTQLDLGANFGLTDEDTDDLTVFTGFTVRF